MAKGKATGHFLVNVGEGRRQACLLRVKRKQIKASEPVRCVVDDTHDPRALSLAENDIRSAMHLADQFAAFQRLVDSGLSVESVAAQFSVSTLVVARRLKLANVAPAFLARYRADEVSLEQLMALALTDDHERQVSLWDALPNYRRTPEGIRQALTETGLSTRSPAVRHVGLKAYEKAGGAVRRDLFSKEGEGFVLDAALLWKLANAKLEKQAAKVKAEGWAWVDVVSEADYSTRAEFGRVQSIQREATEAEQAELARLDQQLAEAQRELEDAEDERVDFLEQLIEEIEEKIEAIDAGRAVPDPEQAAVAGPRVCIDRSGRVKIETGLLRPEDVRRFRKSAKANGAGRSTDDRSTPQR